MNINTDRQCIETLRRLQNNCTYLQLPGTVTSNLIQRVEKYGIRSTQIDIFSALSRIALKLGYQSGKQTHFRQLKDLDQLYSDSGIEPLLQLIDGQVEAIANEVHQLMCKTVHVTKQEARDILRARDLLREDHRLYGSLDPETRELRNNLLTERVRREKHYLQKSRKGKQLSKSTKKLAQRIEEIDQELLHISARERLAISQHGIKPYEGAALRMVDRGGRPEPRLTIRSEANGHYKSFSIEIQLSDMHDVARLDINYKRWNKQRADESRKLIGNEVAIWQELMALEIPHIPQLLDARTTANGTRIYAENFHGGDMTDWFYDHNDSISPTLLKTATLHLLEHVVALHRAGILHRDIKPENLLIQVTEESRGEQPLVSDVVVTDFGFSEKLEEGKDTMETTCGSLAYAAPEILLAQRSGRPGDMWAVGATIFALRYGRVLVDDPLTSIQLTESTALLRHYYCTRSDKTPETLDTLDELILAMLPKYPEERIEASQALLIARSWFSLDEALAH